ncbi:MAG: hypothetical protein MUF62_06200, partial [Chitinophagaceae bacterium]|nr:hypothetical protein [Chitinophagaceae bacterium]
MKAVKLLCLLVLIPLLGISQFDPLTGNPGFENTATFANWVRTGAGTASRSTASRRSGGACAAVANLVNTGFTTLHNTSMSVTVPASGTNYVTVVGWARGSGNTVTVGVDAGTSADPDGPATPGGTTANVGTTYTRVSHTFLATNGATYHPVLYARNNGNNTIRWDDVMIYTSTQSALDAVAPNAPASFVVSTSGTNVTFNFTQGADAGANPSGISGVVILRNTTSPISNSNVTLTSQIYYSNNVNVGPTTGAANFNVVYSGPATGTFTDNFTGLNQAVYLVYMRDQAFNYTASGSAGRVFVVNSTTANYNVANVNNNASLDALFVRAGNSFTIPAASTVTFRAGAASVINGTVEMQGNISTGGVASRLTYASGATFRYRTATSRTIPTATYQPGSTVWINNTANANAPSGGLTQPFGNFRWEQTAQTAAFTLPTGFTANGNLEVISAGSSALQLAAGGTYNIRGNVQIDDDLTAPTNSVLNLNGNGVVQTISGANLATPVLGTLNIATTGGGSVVLARNVQVATAFNIAAGAILNGGSTNATLTLSGAAEFVNNGSYIPGNAKVVYAGNANRAIRGSSATAFHKLEVNNSAVSALADRFVRLETPVTINNQLILANGGLRTNNRVLTIANGAVVTPTEAGNTEAAELAYINSNQTSFIALVDGAGVPATAGGVRRLDIGPGGRTTLVPFAVGYDMPVSASITNFSPVAIQQTAGTADNYTVRSITADSPPGTFSASSVDYTYNLLEEVTGGANCTVRIYWQSDMEGAVFNRAYTSVVHSNGTVVDYFSPGTPTAATAGASPSYWYQQGTGFTSFSPFSVTSNTTILPFVFKTVRARRDVQRAVLAWDIADDRDIAQYLIERQTASGFVQVGSLPARQASGVQAYSFTDAQAPAGTAVYRVIAVGKNGQRTISPQVAIAAANAAPLWVVSPNPVQQKRLHLQLQNMPA